MGRRSRAKRERRRASTGPDRDSVVGFVAVDERGGLCDGDALVVAGSPSALNAMLPLAAPRSWQITSAHFAHVWQCLQLGAAYCFDEAAYRLFLPLARQAGLPLAEQDFSDPGPTGVHLVRVQIHPFP
jgi:hypothetical protein